MYEAHLGEEEIEEGNTKRQAPCLRPPHSCDLNLHPRTALYGAVLWDYPR